MFIFVFVVRASVYVCGWVHQCRLYAMQNTISKIVGSYKRKMPFSMRCSMRDSHYTAYIDYLHSIEYRPYIGKKYNATEYRHYRNYAIALHKMFPFISINWHKSNLYLVEYVCAIFVCNTVHISLSLCLQSIWVCVVAIKRIVWYVCLCNIEKIYTITRFEWKLQCLKIY